jgi:uncharacterized protein (TIGR04255 family)
LVHEYRKAPITEATIEFRLAEPLSDSQLDRLKVKFKRPGWATEDLTEVSVSVGLQAKVVQTPAGQKITSGDGGYIVQILRKSLVVSRNAPYSGWEQFRFSIENEYIRWRKIVGKQTLERIGLRYINRIDIPKIRDVSVRPQDYLMFVPPIVAGFDDPPSAWQMHLTSNFIKHKLSVNLAAATVESPLIGHVSFLLDCDLYRYQVDVPQANAHIWVLLDQFRESKNEIFEACITDSTRRLIA